MPETHNLSYEQTARKFRGVLLQGLEAARMPPERRARLLEAESRLRLKNTDATLIREFDALDRERFYAACPENVVLVYEGVYRAERALQAVIYIVTREV